jgi:hypothetical protein
MKISTYARASFLESIAINYAQAGLNNQARQVAQLIKTPAIRSQLNQRLNCYAKNPWQLLCFLRQPNLQNQQSH